MAALTPTEAEVVSTNRSSMSRVREPARRALRLAASPAMPAPITATSNSMSISGFWCDGIPGCPWSYASLWTSHAGIAGPTAPRDVRDPRGLRWTNRISRKSFTICAQRSSYRYVESEEPEFSVISIMSQKARGSAPRHEGNARTKAHTSWTWLILRYARYPGLFEQNHRSQMAL